MDAGAIKAGQAYISATWEQRGLESGLRGAEGRLKLFGQVAVQVGQQIAGAGDLFMKPFQLLQALPSMIAGLSFAGIIRGASAAGLELEQMSLRTMVAGETLTGLAHALKLGGGTLEDFEHFLAHMESFVIEAVNGSNEAARAIALLGVSLQDLRTASPDRQLMLLADGFKRLGNSAQAIQLVRQIGGRGALPLLPTLQEGSQGIQRRIGEAQAGGRTVSNADIRTLADFERSWISLEGAVKRAGMSLSAAMAPALKLVVDYVTEGIYAASNWLNEHRALVTIVGKIAFAVAGAGTAIIGLNVIIKAAAATMGLFRWGLVGLAGVFTMTAGKLGWISDGLTGVLAAVTLTDNSFAQLARRLGITNTAVLDWISSNESLIRSAVRVGASITGILYAVKEFSALGRFGRALASLGIIAGGVAAAFSEDLRERVRNFFGDPAKALAFAAAMRAVGLVLPLVGAGMSVAVGIVSAGMATITAVVSSAVGVIGAILTFALSGPIALAVTAAIGAFAVAAGAATHYSGLGRQAIDALGRGWDSASTSAQAGFSRVAQAGIASWDALKNAVMSGDLEGAFKIIFALGKLAWIELVDFLEEQWDNFVGWLNGGWNGFVNGAWQGGLDGMLAGFLGTTVPMGDLWGETTGGMSDAWDATVEFLEDAWDTFAGYFEDEWPGLTAVVKEAAEAISSLWEETWGLVSDTLDYVGEHWDDIIDSMTAAWEGFMGPVREGVGEVFTALGSLFGSNEEPGGNEPAAASEKANPEQPTQQGQEPAAAPSHTQTRRERRAAEREARAWERWWADVMTEMEQQAEEEASAAVKLDLPEERPGHDPNAIPESERRKQEREQRRKKAEEDVANATRDATADAWLRNSGLLDTFNQNMHNSGATNNIVASGSTTVGGFGGAGAFMGSIIGDTAADKAFREQQETNRLMAALNKLAADQLTATRNLRGLTAR